MKTKQDNREPLLELKFNELYHWEAKFLGDKKNRFTVSQLKKVGDEDLFANHINLPSSKVELAEPDIELKEGQNILFSTLVGSYESKGWKRGTLLAEKGKKIIVKVKG